MTLRRHHILTFILTVGLLCSGCAHGDEPCTLVAIPVTASADLQSLPAAEGRIQTSCRIMSSKSVGEKIPSGFRSGEPQARHRAAASLRRGVKLFREGELEEGTKLLVAAWERYRADPHLLPVERDERSKVYRGLLAGLRIRWQEEPESARPLCDWLAIHMPDQVPSVNQLPPALAAMASEAVILASRRTAEITVGRPPGCETEPELLVDGLAVGRLPISGQPVVQGERFMWARCGEHDSWIREVALAKDRRLAAPQVELESAVALSRPVIAVLASADDALLARLGPRFRTWLGVSGVVFVPVDEGDERPAILSSPTRALPLHPSVEEPLVGKFLVDPGDLEPGFSWWTAGKWASFSVSAALLACGVTANVLYDDETDRTSTGLEDRRSEADKWRTASLACYIGAGAAFATGATFVAIAWFSDDETTPPPSRFR